MAPTALRKPRHKNKKGAGNPAWKKGCPPPNPKGRPPIGLSLAEIIRAKLGEPISNAPGAKSNLESIIETSVRLARGGDIDHIKFLAERGFDRTMDAPQNPSSIVNVYLPDNGRPDVIINQGQEPQAQPVQ
jgi:hypothetical protein